MDNTSLYNSLSSYFKRLSQVGYIPDNAVFAMVVLIYIQDHNLKGTVIDNTVSCLRKFCFVPYEICKGTCS